MTDADTVREALLVRAETAEHALVVAHAALDRLVAERDALREVAIARTASTEALRQRAEAAEAERDRLREALKRIAICKCLNHPQFDESDAPRCAKGCVVCIAREALGGHGG